jgi:hypothetical protein
MTNTMSLYLVQHPAETYADDPDANEQLLRHFRGSIAIRDINDFLSRIQTEVLNRHCLIQKLVIGSHGFGHDDGSGFFRIGREIMMADDPRLVLLGTIKKFLTRDAEVYILACRTGRAKKLLQQVSFHLGGVRVYGYTDYITSTNFGPLGTMLDDGTDDEGLEFVCWPSICLRGPAVYGWSPRAR